MRSSAGVGTTPPNVPGAPKPTSSVMISSTLGAPFGGTTRGAHHAFDSAAFSLITPPNVGSGGGSCAPLIVVVAPGEPGVDVCGPAPTLDVTSSRWDVGEPVVPDTGSEPRSDLHPLRIKQLRTMASPRGVALPLRSRALDRLIVAMALCLDPRGDEARSLPCVRPACSALTANSRLGEDPTAGCCVRLPFRAAVVSRNAVTITNGGRFWPHPTRPAMHARLRHRP